MRRIRRITLGSLFFLLAGLAAAGPSPRVCERRVLQNGLEAAVERIPGARLLAVHVLVRNRAADEPAGWAGVADLAHRVLLETDSDPARKALLKSLDALGADVKVVDDPAIPFDDYYSVEEFSYVRFQVLDRFRDEGLQLLGELLTRPEITEATLKKAIEAQDQVRVRREKSPRAVAERAWWDSLFPGSWKARGVYGAAGSARGLSLGEFKEWCAKHFRPENLVLTVQTGQTPAKVFPQLAALFPAGGKAVPTRRVTLPEPSAPPSDRTVTVKLASRQGYVLAGDVLPVASADLPALEIAVGLLSDKIAFELREKRGLAYSLGASLDTLDNARAVLSVSMGTRPENVDTARAGILEVVRAFLAADLTPREVEVAVHKARGRFLMRCLLSLSRAYYAGLALYAGRAPCAYRERPEDWAKATPAEVIRVRDKYIHPDAFRWVLVRP